MILRIACCCVLLCLPMLASAAVWTVTYPRPLDDADTRYEYPAQLLRLALEKTGVRYELLPSDRIMMQGKAIRHLRENRAVNVVWSMTDAQREKDLLPIRIPITKGLIGWRVLMIHEDQQASFSNVRTAQQLTQFTPIQGEEWPDTKILQANGFNVLTVPDYRDAYDSLMVRQGDFFPRAVTEAFSELALEDLDSDIVLENEIALHYPTAMYFFVNKSNTTLARLLTTGLMRALEDGTFDSLFERHFADVLTHIKLSERRVFELDNPLLPEETPLNDTKLWFQPSKEE